MPASGQLIREYIRRHEGGKIITPTYKHGAPKLGFSFGVKDATEPGETLEGSGTAVLSRREFWEYIYRQSFVLSVGLRTKAGGRRTTKERRAGAQVPAAASIFPLGRIGERPRHNIILYIALEACTENGDNVAHVLPRSFVYCARAEHY